jgi:deoxyribodipyrimidine photolyase-like uncharacterized protein
MIKKWKLAKKRPFNSLYWNFYNKNEDKLAKTQELDDV